MFNKENEIKTINNLIILKGVILGVVLLFITSTVMAVISGFIYHININALDTVLITENFFIIIIIGLYVARKVEKNGWLNGGLSGLVYMLIILLIGSISIPITIWNILLLALIALIVGGIGGIIGINI